MNGKLLRVDAANPDFSKAEVVVPPSDLVFQRRFIGTDVLHQASDALYLRVIQKGRDGAPLPYGSTEMSHGLLARRQVDPAATSQNVSGAILSLYHGPAPVIIIATTRQKIPPPP